jgi:hypothetical protein
MIKKGLLQRYSKAKEGLLEREKAGLDFAYSIQKQENLLSQKNNLPSAGKIFPPRLAEYDNFITSVGWEKITGRKDFKNRYRGLTSVI